MHTPRPEWPLPWRHQLARLWCWLLRREPPFHPFNYRGTSWYTKRQLSNGLTHYEAWIELCRNKLNTVTVVPAGVWGTQHAYCLERQAKDLILAHDFDS